MTGIRRHPRSGIDTHFQAGGVQLIHHSFHIGEFLVGLDRIVFSATQALPAIVDVDITPAIVGQTALQHGAGGTQHLLLAYRISPHIPGIPAKRRRKGDFIADNNPQFTLVLSQGVGCAQHHPILPCLFGTTGNDAGFLIQRQAFREPRSGKSHRTDTGGRDLKQEISSGAGAINLRPVDAGRLGRRRGQDGQQVAHFVRMIGRYPRHPVRLGHIDQRQIVYRPQDRLHARLAGLVKPLGMLFHHPVIIGYSHITLLLQRSRFGHLLRR